MPSTFVYVHVQLTGRVDRRLWSKIRKMVPKPWRVRISGSRSYDTIKLEAHVEADQPVPPSPWLEELRLKAVLCLIAPEPK